MVMRALSHCSLHWSDLHQALLAALPEGLVRFRHTVTATAQPAGSQRVIVKAERRASEDSDNTEALQLECDLLVAADGSMSATRRRFRPYEARRCAALAVLHSLLATRPDCAVPATCRHRPLQQRALLDACYKLCCCQSGMALCRVRFHIANEMSAYVHGAAAGAGRRLLQGAAQYQWVALHDHRAHLQVLWLLRLARRSDGF